MFLETLTHNIDNVGSAVLRIFIAVLLGGVIGWEREHVSRPAGLRTHILVCVGSALVMLTSKYVSEAYHLESLDLTRMGAQVISGIGFLGAGTIIKEGLSVKGLTTAASLWAISTVGVAVGAGFYAGAIAATLMIFLVLQFLKKLTQRKSQIRDLYISMQTFDETIHEINSVFTRFSIAIQNSELSSQEETKMIRYRVGLPKDYRLFEAAVEKLRGIETIINIHVE